MPSARAKAATTPSTRRSEASRISPASSRRRASTALRSRSTSPSSARPTIPGSRSIRNGSTGGRTAPSNTPRTRRRSTRTSSTSTSIAARFPRSGTRCATSCCSGHKRGVRDLPRRQPAHQADAVLGMDDPRGAGAISRRDLPRRGLHPAEGDEASRQGRLHAVLFLFHLAQHEGGADRISDRADDDRMPPHHAAELLREHARHQSDLPADERARRLPGAPRARRDARRQLRRLQRLRALRGDADPRQGGVPELREIRDQGVGLGPAGPHPPRHPASEPAPARASGAADLHQPELLQRLERQHPLLRQGDAGEGRLPALRREPRSAQRARRGFRGAALGVRASRRGGDRGGGSRHRRAFHLAGQGPAHASRSGRPALRDLAAHPHGAVH